MHLDTYKSAAIDGVFVTLPSTTAKSTIGLLDGLSALRLAPVRREYEFSERERSAPFARFVLTEIVLKGYATHGLDGSFCGTTAPGRVPRGSRGKA